MIVASIVQHVLKGYGQESVATVRELFVDMGAIWIVDAACPRDQIWGFRFSDWESA
jgi:hypothetical protein